MTEQMDLLAGLEAKAEGMRTAIDHAEPDWKGDFRAMIETFAGSGRPFTSEDIIRHVGLPTGSVKSNHNNAVGAMMNAAARKGIIRKTGRRVPSRRPTSHGAELAEWVGR